jgi:hypothetical protein
VALQLGLGGKPKSTGRGGSGAQGMVMHNKPYALIRITLYNTGELSAPLLSLLMAMLSLCGS